MVCRLAQLGLFALLLAVSAVAVDPVTPATHATGVISQFTLNETQKLFSNAGNNSALLTPYQFTAFSEVLDEIEIIRFDAEEALPLTGSLVLSSSSGDLFKVAIAVNESVRTIRASTAGPCAGNALTKLQQSVWTTLNFSLVNLTGVTITGTTSRVYQNAELVAQQPQWILFGPGMLSYYAIKTPVSPNHILQLDLRRVNNSVPSPTKIFHYAIVATDEQCLNPGTPPKPGGSVEVFNISQIVNPDIVTHVFAAPITPSSTIYVQLIPADSLSPVDAEKYNGGVYWIQASFTPPAPAPQNNAGTVFGIICGILIVIGAVGVVYYLYNKKRRQGAEYDKILS